MSETQKLRALLEQLENDHGPHPNGSRAVWREQRADLVTRISAYAVLALEEQLDVVFQRLQPVCHCPRLNTPHTHDVLTGVPRPS